MSNNFSGNVRKNADSFKHKSGSGGVRYAGVGKPVDDAGVGRVVGGVFAGQDAPVVFEKADQPVEPTTPYGRTDGAGERELGLSGEVSHPDASGGAKYTDPASVIRQSIAQLSGLTDTSTVEAREALTALLERIEGKSGKADSGDPLARLEKEGNALLERLRGLIARGAGTEITERSGSGRFVSLGTGEVRNRDAAAREAMTKSLASGVNMDKLVRG